MKAWIQTFPMPWASVRERRFLIGKKGVRRAVLVALLLLSGATLRVTYGSWTATAAHAVRVFIQQTLDYWASLVAAPAPAVAPAVVPARPPLAAAPHAVARPSRMQLFVRPTRVAYVMHLEGRLVEDHDLQHGLLLIARVETRDGAVMAQTRSQPDGAYAIELPFSAHIDDAIDWSVSVQTLRGRFLESTGRLIARADETDIHVQVPEAMQVASLP